MKVVSSKIAAPISTVVALCSLAITTDTKAACPDTSGARPARLVESAEQRKLIAELIPEWTSDENVRMVKFGAYVTEEGDLQAACCASATHRMTSGAYRMLGRKIGRLKFLPASHDEVKQRVHVGFTIVATKTSSGVKSVLLVNQLLSVDSFGINYSAPQRIWSKRMWFDNSAMSGEISAGVRVYVGKSGAASNASVTNRNTSILSRKRAEYYADGIESACFIPGFVNGIAVDMPYAEAFAIY